MAAFALFAGALLLSGASTVEKYLGAGWVPVYLVFATCLLWLSQYVLPWLRSRPRLVWWMAIAAYLVVVSAILVVYPLANVHVPGQGSDNDDALDITTRALLGLRYPYGQTTYLGNPAIPMPGEMLLAAPFVLLGGSAYQVIFWLPVAFLLLAMLARSPATALLLLGSTLLLSPTVVHGLATGSDHLPNSVIVFTAFTLSTLALDRDVATWKRMLAFSFFGLALSTRANFSFLIVVLFGAGVKRSGWRAALLAALVVCGTAALVTIPFYAIDPAGFAPLHTARKAVVFPGGLLVVPALTLIVAAGVALRIDRPIESALRGAYVVLATPILLVVAGSLASSGTWSMAGYADLVLVFGLASYGIDWLRPSVDGLNGQPPKRAA